jgi:hypothetical protein
LLVIKHRQLARQVGAFGEFTLESSTDFDNMIFLAGSTLVFGSWICMADDDDKLQSRLTEIPVPQHALVVPAIMMDQLTEKFSRLSIFYSTWISEVPKEFDYARWNQPRVQSGFHTQSVGSLSTRTL